MMRLGVLAAAGAVLGSALRYAISVNITASVHGVFIYATLAVNLIGALLIGLLARSANIMASEARRHFLITGVLGGFTTFSALAVETVQLAAKNLFLAVAYILITFAGGLLATTVGYGNGKQS